MNVHEAIKARKSVRAFLNKPVSRDQVTRILDAARWSPSGVNTQPWQLAVLTGSAKSDLQQQLLKRFHSGNRGKMDYAYYPEVWPEPYKSRRFACGMALYQTLGIKREDHERRQQQWEANYRAFDAPVMLLFWMDGVMQAGSYMDYGMFLQSVMLAALDEGLATCPQAALVEYPDLLRDFLGLEHKPVMLTGMALGYEDTEARVNQYRTARDEVNSFARFLGEWDV